MKVVYVSTGGFQGMSADAACAELTAHGITAIELSGGAYSDTLKSALEAYVPSVRFQIHNYFPPPATAFALNLGSLDAEIGDRSVAHVRHALEWCGALGADAYSFHAGFLVDPRADELGGPIASRRLFDRARSVEVFVDRVRSLADIARRTGITLFVENNVLSAANLATFQGNPLLMCEPSECRQVMARMPDNVRLMVDVGHLKVSAAPLAFEPSQMFMQCDEWIGAYHLSDNDGLRDSNQPLGPDAWFWPYLKTDVTYYAVEVYGVPGVRLAEQVALVRSMLRSRNA